MSDTRTVATDALATLGKIIDDQARRDAIHLAVLPAFAGEPLRPGERVIVNNGVARRAIPGCEVGIVDPFLADPVAPRERFWVIVLPRTIQSLRHVWTHPEIPDGSEDPVRFQSEEKEENLYQELGRVLHEGWQRSRELSERWLREFCDRSNCPSYEDVMIAIKERGGRFGPHESLCMDRDAGGDIPPEFWDHVEVVLGLAVANRPAYFSCSC